jgi:hypothetical protein
MALTDDRRSIPFACPCLGRLLVGCLLLVPLGGAAETATVRIDPPPVRAFEPAARWPDLLQRADAASAIRAIRAQLEAGEGEAARQLALAEVRRLPADRAEGRDARLALATVEAALGAPAARERYQEVIEAAELAGGLLDPHRLPALRGQAFLALAFEDYPAADEALNDALQLHRRHYGLFDVGQLDYLAALTRLAALAGDKAEADRLQRRRLDVATRHYPADDPRLIEVYDDVAENYRQLILPVEMYGALRRKRLLLEQQWGSEDPRLIPSLLEEARAGLLATRMSETPQPWDTAPLRRAQALTAALDADGAALEKAQALVAIGDLFWLVMDSRQSLNAYREALALSPDLASRLARPEVILWPGFEPPPGAVESAGRLRIRFQVTARGRAVGIRLDRLDPPEDPQGRQRAEIWQRVVSQTFFRPAVVDRRPRTVKDVLLEDRFRPAS